MKPNVTIYSTHTCHFCHMEKAWLDEHQVAYTNYFVDEDDSKANEMIKRSGQMAVPVTIISGPQREEIVIGFDRPKLAKLLGV